MAILHGEAQHIGYGQRRTTLEDRMRFEEITTAGGMKLSVGIVADGIGGASAGENAGEIAVSVVFNAIRQSNNKNVALVLKEALESAHGQILGKQQERREWKDMGTTATVAAITDDNRLFLAHAGDSRAYLMRDGKLQQLTIDHNWGIENLRAGRLSEQDAMTHSRRDELVRFLGIKARPLEIDLGIHLSDGLSDDAAKGNQGVALKAGDAVLLCTDGLIKSRPRSHEHFVEPDEIVRVLRTNEPLDAVNTLVAYAISREVDDNVTAVVLEMPGGKKAFASLAKIPQATVALAAIGGALVVLAVMLAIVFLFVLPLIQQSSQPEIPENFAFASQSSGPVESQIPGEDWKPISGQLVRTGEGALVRTGPGGRLVLIVGDNTTLYLDEMTTVGLNNVNAAQGDIQLIIHGGKLLVNANLQPGRQLIVRTTINTQATVLGSVMGVEYRPDNQRLDADCLEGHCRLTSVNKSVDLETCQHSGVFSIGDPQPPDASRNAFWQPLGGEVVPPPESCVPPTGTPLPTFTPVPAVTPQPTYIPPAFTPVPTAEPAH